MCIRDSDKPVYDDKGEEIKNPTRAQFLARVDLSNEEQAQAEKQARAYTQLKESVIMEGYRAFQQQAGKIPGGIGRNNALNIRDQASGGNSRTTLLSPSELGGGYLDNPPAYDDGEGTNEELEAELRALEGSL